MSLVRFYKNLTNCVFTQTKEALLEHVWREINRGGDPVSVPTTRHYEIYSKMTGNRVQMRGRRVDANGVAGSKRGKKPSATVFCIKLVYRLVSFILSGEVDLSKRPPYCVP